MITKLAIVCLCVAASAMIGIARLKSKKNRLACLESLVRLTDTLISEISFRKDNLLKLLDEFAANDKTELKVHIEKFCASPYAPLEVKSKLLKRDEKRLLSEFLSSLGVTCGDTQIFELENYKKKFEALLAGENEKYKKTANTELKLFILAGLAVGILLL